MKKGQDDAQVMRSMPKGKASATRPAPARRIESLDDVIDSFEPQVEGVGMQSAARLYGNWHPKNSYE